MRYSLPTPLSVGERASQTSIRPINRSRFQRTLRGGATLSSMDPDDRRDMLLSYFLPRHAARVASLRLLTGEEGLSDSEIARLFATLQQEGALPLADQVRLLGHLLLLQECDLGSLLALLATREK